MTNHAHVLICIQEDHSIRTRSVAERVGITERAVQHIISDLPAGRYLTRTREGRRNRYEIHADRSLRHPVEVRCLLSSLLKTVDKSLVSGRWSDLRLESTQARITGPISVEKLSPASRPFPLHPFCR